MTVKKCNKCRKLIKHSGHDGISISVNGPDYLLADLCTRCATPFLKDFKKHTRLIFDETKLGIESGK